MDLNDLQLEELVVPPTDHRLLVPWLEKQPEQKRGRLVRELFEQLLHDASQPRHASGNACINLCYFLERCRSSRIGNVRQLVLSQKTCLDLLNYFIEWNEKNQNRSMRSVLELLSSVISLISVERVSESESIKSHVLQRIAAILTHRAAQPLVKPAFKALECFLSKAAVVPQDFLQAYKEESRRLPSRVSDSSHPNADWDAFVLETFEWMSLADISPAAGKLLVTLFISLRKSPKTSENSTFQHVKSWQRWVRTALASKPDSLENIKNHVFSPLFKLDRVGSLAFLEEFNDQTDSISENGPILSSQALLQLAAMEVGKRVGLIVDPGNDFSSQKTSKKMENVILLQEKAVAPLLSHSSHTVRSLAFSVLVSSSSSTKPFSGSVLEILQRTMSTLHADTDAKFRNEVLSQTKHMIERVRGASVHLVKELQKESFSIAKTKDISHGHDNAKLTELNNLLLGQINFVKWYIEFLLEELVPTASYQRHITALRALTILLKSGISHPHTQQLQAQAPNSRWSHSINVFTTGCMRRLLDLLMDPFEEVRIHAIIVLKFANTDDFAGGRSMAYVEDPIPMYVMEGSSPVVIGDTSSSRPLSDVTISPSLGVIKDFIVRSSEMSKRTGRADYADGIARCYQLLYGLQSSALGRLDMIQELVDELTLKVTVAEADLSKAVAEAPVHGLFSALSLVWECIDPLSDCRDEISGDESIYHGRWYELQKVICTLCRRVWDVVSDVLCNDSPEGHLPEDMDAFDTIDTKDVLSYSFRAIHESSNLMRNMASKISSVWHDGAPMLNPEQFVEIGNLTFTQLSSLRHRGAFSTVSLTFSKCCQLTEKPRLASDEMISVLLTKWYQGALACIFEQVSTTRRSAGIPALITGILSAKARNPAFEDVMNELKSLARIPVVFSQKDQTQLPQVHAMNCLKEIFKSSVLGVRADGHIADCLQLASDSLSSDTWAIRNCALILLRSLIDCLFGTNDNKMTTEAGWDGLSVKLSYEKYPSLPGLLLRMLSADTDLSSKSFMPVLGVVESVFPALDIIRRAGPPTTHKDAVYKYVSLHLGSKLWHVREIAARTISTMVDKDLDAVVSLVRGVKASINRTHGVLMAVKFVLERRESMGILSITDGLEDVLSALNIPLAWERDETGNREILAAYFEIANSVAKTILSIRKAESKSGEPDSGENLLEYFSQHALQEFMHLQEIYAQGPRDGSESENMLATLGSAIARRAVYTAALNKDEVSLQIILTCANSLNVDIVLAALECIPDAWDHMKSRKSLEEIAKAYIELLKVTTSSEVGALALTQLKLVLDRIVAAAHAIKDRNDIAKDAFSQLDIKSLHNSCKSMKDTPSFSNSRLAISALILLEELSSRQADNERDIFNTHLISWAHKLSLATEATNDFETRHAAATALSSFYTHPLSQTYLADPHALPSLLVLYDTLNDDDDEIRDLSAQTTSVLLHTSVLPLAASVELAKLLSQQYGHSAIFSLSVISRMIGTPKFESAEIQLSRALKNDDSLFVVEEQNLFSDEVRETKIWCGIFTSTSISTDSPCYNALAKWTQGGLNYLVRLLRERKDGPLGWTTKPSVFATCMRVVLCAKAVLAKDDGTAKEDITSLLAEFTRLGKENKVHESLLVAGGMM